MQRAVSDAARKAKLNYGRKKNGFTLHSLRHCYITTLLPQGVAPTVMNLSGHKSYKAFSVYLHATDLGRKRARLNLESVDGFLTGLESEANSQNNEHTDQPTANILPLKQVKVG